MYLTLKYYISLGGVAKGYGFLESRAMMLYATGQDLTTCITRRLNHLNFVLFTETPITLFLKLLKQAIFLVSLDALQRISVVFAKTCIQGFQNMDYLCRFNLFPTSSMVAY